MDCNGLFQVFFMRGKDAVWKRGKSKSHSIRVACLVSVLHGRLRAFGKEAFESNDEPAGSNVAIIGTVGVKVSMAAI